MTPAADEGTTLLGGGVEKVQATPDGRVMGILDEGDRPPVHNTRLMYSDSARSLVNGLTERATHTPDEAQKIADGYTKVFASLSLTPGQAGDMFSAVRTAHLSKPSTADRQAWIAETQQLLVREYGAAGAANALRGAQQVLDGNKVLKRELTALGLLSHPRVIATLANRAHEARKVGKLK